MSSIESLAVHSRQAAIRLSASTEDERNEALLLFKVELHKQQVWNIDMGL